MRYSSLDSILEKLERGEARLRDLDAILGNSNLAALARRAYLEKSLGVVLSSVASSILDFEAMKTHVSGTVVGAIQTPLHVVGPVMLKGRVVRGLKFIPLALLDNSGLAVLDAIAEVVNESGGISVEVDSLGLRLNLLGREDGKPEAWSLVGEIESTISRGRWALKSATVIADRNCSSKTPPALEVELESLEKAEKPEDMVGELLEDLQARGYSVVEYALVVNGHAVMEVRKTLLETSLRTGLRYPGRRLHRAGCSMLTARLLQGLLTATGVEAASLSFVEARSRELSPISWGFEIRGSLAYANIESLDIALKSQTHGEALSLIESERRHGSTLMKISEIAIALIALGELSSTAVSPQAGPRGEKI